MRVTISPATVMTPADFTPKDSRTDVRFPGTGYLMYDGQERLLGAVIMAGTDGMPSSEAVILGEATLARDYDFTARPDGAEGDLGQAVEAIIGTTSEPLTPDDALASAVSILTAGGWTKTDGEHVHDPSSQRTFALNILMDGEEALLQQEESENEDEKMEEPEPESVDDVDAEELDAAADAA